MKKRTISIFIVTILICTQMFSFADVSDWAKESVYKVKLLGILPKGISDVESMKKNISREEFSELLFNFYALIKDDDACNYDTTHNFKDIDNKKVVALSKIGIVSGTSKDTFSPKSNITREQMAIMIKRLVDKIGNTGFKASNGKKFSDNKYISSWASDGVYFCLANGLISGVGGNKFSPKSSASVEQVISIMSRLDMKISGMRYKSSNDRINFNGYNVPRLSNNNLLYSSNKAIGIDLRITVNEKPSGERNIESQLMEIYSVLKNKLAYADVLQLCDFLKENYQADKFLSIRGKKLYIKDGKVLTAKPQSIPYISMEGGSVFNIDLIR